MLTSLDFLQPGQPWPPKDTEERERLIKYRDNRALFEGRHELVFHEVWERLFRRDPTMMLSIEMILGWPKRLSTLWADLLVGETPTVNDANSEQSQYISDLVKRLDLWHCVYLAALDTSRYGNALFKVRRDEGGVKVSIIPPSCWFPVVSDIDAKEVSIHALAWPTGDVDAGTGRLHVELHTPGHVEYRDYERGGSLLTGNSGGNIGKLLEQSEENTGVDAPLVVPVSNLETSDAIYGHDDYSDLTSIIQELEVRFAQLARILDKHADPKMYGPDVTRIDEKTGLRVADIGNYIPLQDKTDVMPGYLVWDAQTESSFKQIEMLMQQFYILSETSPAVFGEIKSGLAESGSALKRLLLVPLAKVNRVRSGFDAAVREVIRLSALLDSGRQADPVIEWKDGLPDDDAEMVQTEAVAVGAGITSKFSAMKRAYGYDDDQAEEELKRISDEEPKLEDPTSLEERQGNEPDDNE